MALLASQLQPVIDELIAEGVNTIVLMAHLQILANEQALAPLLSGVDVILSAGSNTRLGDANDVAVAFSGHAANFAGTYPIVTAGLDGKPTLIVSTDNEDTYLGRLVLNFDANGEIVTSDLASLAPINGANAATDANVAAASGVPVGDLGTTAYADGTKGENVEDLTAAVNGVFQAKDGEAISGGGLPIVSLKNGGGIRAAIGAVDVVTGAKNPPLANSSVGKAAGGVSLLDIENSMRFNNLLMAFDTTPAGLKAILEHGMGSLGNQGRFPQVGGVAFSYDPARTAGDRVRSVALIDENGEVTQPLVQAGAVLPLAPPAIRLVTLSFLAQGGDSYPMKANGENFRYLLTDGTLSAALDEALDFGAAPNIPVSALGEQAAMGTYLVQNFGTPGTAFNEADTVPADDLRIQNLSVRTDAVLSVTVSPTVAGSMGGTVSGGGVYPLGGTASFTAIPAPGFVLQSWTVNGSASSETSPTLSVAVSFGLTVEATFSAKPPGLALSVSAGGTVTVSDTNGPINPLADQDVNSPTYDVLTGTNLSLVATADAGFEFVRWVVDGVGLLSNPLAVTMNADAAVSAEFAAVANTTGPANGFSDAEVAALEAFLSQLRVGDTVNLSLPVTLAPGTRLVVTGLPAGLRFDAATRSITGTVLAELGDGAVTLQIRTVATNAVVESISLRFVVLPFLFTGGYEAIIENVSNVLVGRVRLTVTSPTSASAVLEQINEKGLARTISGTRIAFGALSGGVLPANLSFPALPAPSSLAATTAVMNLGGLGVSDLVTGTQGLTNTLRGFRLVRPGRSPVQPVTVAFENGTPGDRLLTPGGSGFGTGAVNSSGVLPLKGSLGDGQSYTTTLRISETNQAVVWMQPYTDKIESFIGGIIDVGSLVVPGRGGPSPSTPIADGLRWAKRNRTAEKSYPGGFGVATALGGAPTTPLAVDGFVSKWSAVGTVDGLSRSLGLSTRNLNATYVAPPVAPQLPVGRALPTQFNLRGAFSLVRLTPPNSVNWAGTAVPTNGRFTGSPVLATPLPASVRGVFLQDPQSGAPTKVGVGFVRIPTNRTGSFQTSGIRFDQ